MKNDQIQTTIFGRACLLAQLPLLVGALWLDNQIWKIEKWWKAR